MSAASPVEKIKTDSNFLRGTLSQSLADSVTGSLREDDLVLIKFHGSYQQDDRDLREERRQQKLEPDYSFMIRTRTPGGVATPQQWLQLDAIATRYANHSLRITTRQAFQFHGVIKRELKATMAAINASLIDTIAACGDVNRNVLSAANPLLSSVHGVVHEQAKALSEYFLPKTRAYYEIWLDEQQVAGTPEHEPIYGNTYLPRKFKTAFAVPPLNDVDLFANDLGFIAIIENGTVVGYNLTVGGGLGATHGDAVTYPRLADVIGFVPVDEVIAAAHAVITTQRDWGNRAERKRSRLKYTIDDRGLDAFKAEVEQRIGHALQAARPFHFDHNGDRFGWVQGEDGDWHLTLRIEAGRVIDRGERRLLSGLREIARIHSGDFRLTGNQNLVIARVTPALKPRIDALVEEYGLDLYRSASPLHLTALACVALPTCSLAMAEAERYLPDFVAKLEARMAAHGLADAPLHLRISGCPNGCSRPYLGEIALVGKAPGRYNLMLGADHRGQRLNRLHKENIAESDILDTVDALLGRYAAERDGDERFGDYLVRSGIVAAKPSIALEVRT